jgi:hypothetical protein
LTAGEVGLGCGLEVRSSPYRWCHMVEAVQPLSDGMQIGLRIPVILLALFGVVFAFVTMRRLGVATGVLVALGSLFIAVDQLLNILWVLDVTSTASEANYDVDTLTSTNNLYTVADAALITIGAGFVVASVVVRRITGGPKVPAQAAFPGPPGFVGPVPPGFSGHLGVAGQAGQPIPPGFGSEPGHFTPQAYQGPSEAANPEARG